MLDHISYRRGLNGKMVAKWLDKAGLSQRRWLSMDEARQIEKTAHQLILDLQRDINSGEISLQQSLPKTARTGFERIINFSDQRYEEDVARYYQAYQPVGILPPDQYMAVVLQATEGCSFNSCTFCDFYRDRPFHIKSISEFRDHAEAVRDFLGAGLSLRRTIFLGDANALVIPTPRLLSFVDIVHEYYDVEALGGLFGFLDGFSGDKKTITEYKQLAERGFQRIYIGLESGNAELLQLLKKPGNPEDVTSAVHAIKGGGIAVGIIVLLGAGGKTFAQAHIRDTIAVINAMHLDLNDLIYFSELIETEGLDYTSLAKKANLVSLTPEQRIAQGDEIERGLHFSSEGGVPHISHYDIREFVY